MVAWSVPPIIFFFLTLFITLPQGTSFNNNANGFPDNTLLTCMVPDRNGNSVPEIPKRVPFQPGPQGTVWLPQNSSFDRPGIEPLDTVRLAQFLADSLQEVDVNFLSFEEPIRQPPLARNAIPVEGSGGRMDMLFRREENPTPDPALILPADRDAVMRFIDRLGLGICEPVAQWTKLPANYFPSYFAGTRCPNPLGAPSCSFPEGMQCEPDISTPNRMAYIRALRWDCCWSFISNGWTWQCGWRRVEIPIVVDCNCGCQPIVVRT